MKSLCAVTRQRDGVTTSAKSVRVFPQPQVAQSRTSQVDLVEQTRTLR